MKIVFIFLLVISFQNCLAQSYHPFPNSNAKWSEENYLYGAQPGGFSTTLYHGWLYALGDDTLIDSLHYTLVGYQATYSYQFVNSDLEYASNSTINPPGMIFGAIREDSTKKIWFKKLPANPSFSYSCFAASSLPVDTEVLLYDFNLQVGDTLPWGPNFMNVVWKTVIAIDSIHFSDGSLRKRYKFYFPLAGDEYWIEGMGSTLGLFGARQLAPDPWSLASHDCWLNCFWNNGESLFKKTPFPSNITCDATTLPVTQDPSNILDTTNFEIALQPFPNPFTGSVTIEFTLATPSQTSLQIFNMNGIQIKSLLQNENLKAGTHSINFYAENNPLGVYYYVLSYGEKTEVGKMVLVR